MEEEKELKQEGSLKQKGESVVKKAEKSKSVMTAIKRIMSVPIMR